MAPKWARVVQEGLAEGMNINIFQVYLKCQKSREEHLEWGTLRQEQQWKVMQPQLTQLQNWKQDIT